MGVEGVCMVVCCFPLTVKMTEWAFIHCLSASINWWEDINRSGKCSCKCHEWGWWVKGWKWLMEGENKDAKENQGREVSFIEFDSYTSWLPTEHWLLCCPHPSSSWNKNIHRLQPHPLSPMQLYQTDSSFHLPLPLFRGKSSTDAEMPGKPCLIKQTCFSNER